MEKKKQRTKDDEEQSKRFIESAKEVEADETEESADRAFIKVARAPASSTKQRGPKRP